MELLIFTNKLKLIKRQRMDNNSVKLEKKFHDLLRRIRKGNMKDLKVMTRLGSNCYEYFDTILKVTRDGNSKQRDFKRLTAAIDLFKLFEQEVKRDECVVNCGAIGGMRIVCSNGHSICKECYVRLVSRTCPVCRIDIGISLPETPDVGTEYIFESLSE